MAEQIPINEILDDSKRIFKSWISVEEKDSQGELIPIDHLENVLLVLMQRGGPLIDSHSNKPIGKLLKYERAMHPVAKKMGIKGTFQVFSDYALDTTRWNQVKNGQKTGISVGGQANAAKVTNMLLPNGDVVKVLNDFECFELSLVDAPSNQNATITEINNIAKSDAPVTNETANVNQPAYSQDDEKINYAIKAGANDPWVICTATVGRGDNAKFESCVLQLKEKFGIAKDATEPNNSETDKTKGDNEMANEQVKETKKEEITVSPPAAETAQAEEAKPAEDFKAYAEKIIAGLMQVSEKQDKILEMLSGTPEEPAAETAPEAEVMESKSKASAVKVEVNKNMRLSAATPRPPEIQTEEVKKSSKTFDFLDIALGKKKLYE